MLGTCGSHPSIGNEGSKPIRPTTFRRRTTILLKRENRSNARALTSYAPLLAITVAGPGLPAPLNCAKRFLYQQVFGSKEHLVQSSIDEILPIISKKEFRRSAVSRRIPMSVTT